jgi:hypothetical protein
MTRRTLGGPLGRRALAMFLNTGAAVLVSAVPAIAQRGPAQAAVKLSPDTIALACAPTIAYGVPDVPLRIAGGQEAALRLTHAPGDLVTINAGTRGGLAVGQEFYTRRLLTGGLGASRGNPVTIRTTGWIRVWAVDDEMSLATITHACETVDVDDYLEPFVLPSLPAASTATGTPERGNYGHVMTGQDRRTTFGNGDYLVVDRGSDHGVTAGARFVVYHDQRADGNFLFQVGEAVAVDVKTETSTLKVVSAVDAIYEGDYVGMRK